MEIIETPALPLPQTKPSPPTSVCQYRKFEFNHNLGIRFHMIMICSTDLAFTVLYSSYSTQELQERVQGVSQAQGHHSIPHLNRPWWCTLLFNVSVRHHYSWFCNSHFFPLLLLQLRNRHAVVPFEATKYI